MVALTVTGAPSFVPGLELPLLDGFDGLQVEPRLEAASHLEIAGDAIGPDVDAEHGVTPGSCRRGPPRCIAARLWRAATAR